MRSRTLLAGLALGLAGLGCGRSRSEPEKRPIFEPTPVASNRLTSASASSTAPATTTTTSTVKAYTCNAPKAATCSTMKPPAFLLKGVQGGCEMGTGGVWSEGESCAMTKIVATCRKEMHSEVIYFYESKTKKLKDRERSCTAFGGTWELASK